MTTATETAFDITVNTQVLAQELRLLKTYADDKNTIPILTNLKMWTEGDTLHFFATDLQVGLATSCKATVTVPGAVTVPAVKFAEILEQPGSESQNRPLFSNVAGA